MTRLDIDPRFAAAHYQDGRDLRGDAQQPSVHQTSGDLLPLNAVRTGEEVAPSPRKMIDDAVNRFLGWPLPKTFGPDCFIEFDRERMARQSPASWPTGTNLFTAEEAREMFVHALGGFAPDWSLLESTQASLREYMAMVKELREQLAQLGDVSVPPEVAGQRQPQDHPESCGSTQPAAVPAYQPMTDEDVLKQSGAAIRALLSLIRRDAPALSGKVIGNAEAALSAIESAVLARVAAAPAAVQPVAQQQPSVHQGVGSGLPSQAVRTGDEAGVPSGWKLVPVEPTAEMWRAADEIDDRMFAGGSSHGAETGQIWEAMLDAAPAPSLGAVSVPAETASGATGQDEHEPGALNAQPAAGERNV